MDLEFQHDESKQCFYVIVDGKISHLKYRKINEQTLVYASTFVPQELRNKKIAARIVEYALKYATDHHYFVIPSCSFVKDYIDRHPQYRNLVQS